MQAFTIPRRCDLCGRPKRNLQSIDEKNVCIYCKNTCFTCQKIVTDIKTLDGRLTCLDCIKQCIKCNQPFNNHPNLTNNNLCNNCRCIEMGCFQEKTSDIDKHGSRCSTHACIKGCNNSFPCPFHRCKCSTGNSLNTYECQHDFSRCDNLTRSSDAICDRCRCTGQLSDGKRCDKLKNQCFVHMCENCGTHTTKNFCQNCICPAVDGKVSCTELKGKCKIHSCLICGETQPLNENHYCVSCTCEIEGCTNNKKTCKTHVCKFCSKTFSQLFYLFDLTFGGCCAECVCDSKICIRHKIKCTDHCCTSCGKPHGRINGRDICDCSCGAGVKDQCISSNICKKHSKCAYVWCYNERKVGQLVCRVCPKICIHSDCNQQVKNGLKQCCRHSCPKCNSYITTFGGKCINCCDRCGNLLKNIGDECQRCKCIGRLPNCLGINDTKNTLCQNCKCEISSCRNFRNVGNFCEIHGCPECKKAYMPCTTQQLRLSGLRSCNYVPYYVSATQNKTVPCMTCYLTPSSITDKPFGLNLLFG
jgi:hypothetical protein